MMSLPAWRIGPMFLLEVSLLKGYLSRGISVHGSLSGGGSLSTGPSGQRPPSPYGYEWAIRIALECFLILIVPSHTYGQVH